MLRRLLLFVSICTANSFINTQIRRSSCSINNNDRRRAQHLSLQRRQQQQQQQQPSLLLLNMPFKTKTSRKAVANDGDSPNWKTIRIDGSSSTSSDDDENRETTTTATMTTPSQKEITERLLRQRPVWSESGYRSSLALHGQLTACTDSYVAGPIEAALNCLDHAYRLYGPESVICSFNGGKDAVAVLHLVRAACAKYYSDLEESGHSGTRAQEQTTRRRITRPRVIYFDHEDEFPEIVDFLHETCAEYDLDMIAFDRGIKFSQGLEVLVDHNIPENSGIAFPMAFVLGTRSTDPNAGQQGSFAPSSHYMPPFMRVNPILDWTYGHVWHFLRFFHLPYCCLYDQGYTSLGTTKDTLPCPALAVVGRSKQNNSSDAADGLPKFWPAYMLRDWDQERAGRLSKPKGKKQSKQQQQQPQKTTISSGSNNVASQGDNDTSLGNISILSKLRSPESNEKSSDSSMAVEDAESAVSFTDDIIITQKSVGILIIGDEILKGFTADANTFSAAKALRENNVLLKRVVVVSDDQDNIVKEIERLREEVDVIITSGGVGPTHDDVTIKSVASALDCEMVLNEEMVQLLRDKMEPQNGGDDNDDVHHKKNAELTDAQIKMATLPCSAKLRSLTSDPTEWPVLQCRNIFVLPGVPEFFSKKIQQVANYLSCQLQRSKAYKVVLSVDENSIVPMLNRVVENHPAVSFGSYPFVSHPEFKTVITVEGRLASNSLRSNSTILDRSLIDAEFETNVHQNVLLALDELINTLPEGSVLRVDNDDLALSC